MSNPPEMAHRQHRRSAANRAKVANVEAEEQARVVAWLKSRPGVFGPMKSATDAWQEAFRTFGGSRCGLGFFQFQIRRIGYGVEEAAGGYRLDLSDPCLVSEAE